MRTIYNVLCNTVHWYALIVALGFVAWHSYQLQPWTLDDAYISMRYAENFAEGKGIVYNEGEYTEGYTTFLWVFLLGIGNFIGFELPLLSKVLGGFFGVGALALVAFSHRFIRTISPGTSALAVLAAGSCPVFTGWVLSSMETPMVAFWLTLGMLLHIYSRANPEKTRLVPTVGVVCALAALSRPECALLFGVLVLDRCVESIRHRNLNFFYFGLAFSAIFVPYWLWRWWYYGWFFPNTFYAKVGTRWAQVERGSRYVLNFAETFYILLIPAVLGVLTNNAGNKKYTGVAVLHGYLIIHVLYVTAVGGDVMPAFRFFTPVLPLLGLAIALFLGAITRNPIRGIALAAILVGFNYYQLENAQPIRRLGGKVGAHGKVVGKWLRENKPPDTVIATNTAGSIPFFSKLKTIDMLGLNDEHIAHVHVPTMGSGHTGHEKGDGEYVLDRKPEIIQFGSASGSRQPRSFKGDRQIWRDKRFHQAYEFKQYRMPNGRRLQIYERRPEGEIERIRKEQEKNNAKNSQQSANKADQNRRERLKRLLKRRR